MQSPVSQLITSALINAYNHKNQLIQGRALLDTCSSANFITETFMNKLGIAKKKCSIPVGSLGDITTVTNHVVMLTIRSMHSKYEKTITCLSVPEISKLVPNEYVSRKNIYIPNNLPLADPNFNKPSPVDLLIGSGPTLSMLCIGQLNFSKNGGDLCIQKTRLGWVVGGTPCSERSQKPQVNCHLIELQKLVTSFWEVEDGQNRPHFSVEEEKCENHFLQHVTRTKSGNYVVALPFKDNKGILSESFSKALNRFKSLMYKFDKRPEFKEQYTKVMNEYVSLNHMSEVKNVDSQFGFYLPHHAVIKENSLSTKLRVVFDGSAKTKNGTSLNQQLMVGPTIQKDIISLVLNFRVHKFVITADIEKMYRQIFVREEDRKYLRLIWGDLNHIRTFELNTVPFGISSAPFLAIRSLHKLAEDEGHKFPLAAKILVNDLYVDNLLSGANTIEMALKIRYEITELLKLGGFNLRQWGSNEPKLLCGLDKESIISNVYLDKDQPVKTLGISWNAKVDSITYTVASIETEGVKLSKRAILSKIATIYDPLGLLGPIILYAKQIMQKLWEEKLDWDESVPQRISSIWLEFCSQLSLINNLSFNRKIICNNPLSIQLHGFCDASERGYGACIYFRTTDSDGKILLQLVYAKSRVAPLKTISLPRLELCGAVLLSQITNQIKSTMDVSFDKTILWSDSTIALHWIKSQPNLLKTFVANRVADIQKHSDTKEWRHVRSSDNPADALSRGQLPREFMKNKQWKHGPSWLNQIESDWPSLELQPLNEIPETRKVHCLAAQVINIDLLSKYSSYNKLKRIIAYCMRFKYQKKCKGSLTIEELNNAEMIIVKLIQNVEFSNEIRDLKEKKRVNNKSKLITLDPFLDENGILRVGGRLKNSNLKFSQKFPTLLPRSHHVTNLIINHYHDQNYHSGIQSTLYALRQKFWIIDGRNRVRNVIHKCLKCFRINPPNTEYVMANLPNVRLTQARPFSNVGIDYCGPFYIKEKKFRNRGRIKVYVAVFVCLVVKAIHLEIVSDLTTEGFIAALKRFIARRGKPSNIYSDNGTNFVGAKNELQELYVLLNSNEHQQRCDQILTDQNVKWHFIPPLSPHFGGIWESSVKSFKHHLKRIVTDQLFTFEEFNTFVIEIEAILNSRPLTPLSTDPNDPLVLTPGHFLIGDALTSLPEADLKHLPINKLSNWQHIQKMRQHFWSRWFKEYLNELNIRTKWTTGRHYIKEGTVVILKENSTLPMQWPLGRVIKAFPGEDGIIRTVIVKTANSEIKRNVRQLSALPIKDNDEVK